MDAQERCSTSLEQDYRRARTDTEIEEDIQKRHLNFNDDPDAFDVNVTTPVVDFEENGYEKLVTGQRTVLLMNVIEFKPGTGYKRRDGAGVDTRQLRKLWKGMGWNVVTLGTEPSETHPEGGYITKDDVTNAIKKLKALCTQKFEWVEVDMDAIIVYISSHGNNDSFITSDAESINICEDIVYQFDHTTCPKMKGKPKIFFQNTCTVWGNAADDIAYAGRETVPPEAKEAKVTVQSEAEKTSRIDDAILVKANIPGREVYRHPNKGSHFAVTLILVCMNFAWKYDFHILMEKVQDYLKLIKARTNDPYVPCSQPIPFGKLKKFYLFPPPPQLRRIEISREIPHAPIAQFRPLPSPLSYYVGRKIRSRIVLNKDVIFTTETSDIFLFQGIEKLKENYLKAFNKHSSNDSFDELGTLSGNYIILKRDDHFAKICKQAEKQLRVTDGADKINGVHWIQHDSGKFLWVKSGNGDMSRIQRATEGMAQENQVFKSEVDFITHLDKANSLDVSDYGNSPVLIGGTPGMGKSNLLISLANRIATKDGESKNVFFVNIIHLVDELNKNSKILELLKEKEEFEKLFEEALVRLTTDCGPDLDNSELKSKLHSTTQTGKIIKAELFLDGYDEVGVADLGLAKKILNLLQSSYHSLRFWLATRNHRLHELENELHTIGFTILPFDQSDQVELLKRFWHSEEIKSKNAASSQNTEIHKDFGEFATHCLKTLNRFWVPASERADIGRVPLLCGLIAKEFCKECLNFVNRKDSTEKPDRHLLPNTQLIKKLYTTLIAEKFKIYRKMYAKHSTSSMERTLLNFHYFLALQLIVPKYAQLFEKALTCGPIETLMEDSFKLGIVDEAKIDTSKRTISSSFDHRIVVEFLVARFVAEELSKDEELDEDDMLTQIGKSNPRNRCTDYNLGNILFDGVLRTVELKRKILEVKRVTFEKFEFEALAFFLDSFLGGQSDKFELSRLKEIVAGRKRPMKACLYGDHFHLLQALSCEYECMDVNTQITAVTRASMPLLKHVFNNAKLSEMKGSQYTKCGFSIGDGTEPKFVEEEFLSKITNPYSTILHFAVQCRGDKIVEYLKDLLSIDVNDPTQPSIQDLVHALVINSNENPEWLIKEKIKVLKSLSQHLVNGQSAFRTKFKDSFKDFEERKRLELYPKHIQIPTPLLQENVHVKLILELMALGANPRTKRDDGSNLLHSCATKLSPGDFHEVLMKAHQLTAAELGDKKLTAQQVKALVDAKTSPNQKAVLHEIAENMHWEKPESSNSFKQILEHFKEIKVDFAAKDSKGGNCLQIAASVGNVGAVRLFLELEECRVLVTQEMWNHLLTNAVDTVHLEEVGKLLLGNNEKTFKIYYDAFVHQMRSRRCKNAVPFKFAKNYNTTTRDDLLHQLLPLCIEGEDEQEPWFEGVELLLKATEVEAGDNDVEVSTLPVDTLSAHLHSLIMRGSYNSVKTLSLLLSKSGELGSVEMTRSAFHAALRSSDYLTYDEFQKLANSLWKERAKLLAEGGNALLNECAREGLLNGVKYLLENGVSVNRKYKGDNALHAHIKGSKLNADMVQYLLKEGAKIKWSRLKMWFERRASELGVFRIFLMCLTSGKQLLREWYVPRILRKVLLLWDSLKEHELLKIAGRRELEGRIRQSHPAIISLLHCAAQRRHVELIKLLKEKGADVNMRVAEKDGALVHAALSTCSIRNEPKHLVDTLKLLFGSGADRKARNGNNKTILDVSLESPNQRWAPVVKYILETGHFDDVVSDQKFIMDKVTSVEDVAKLQELIKRFIQVTKIPLQNVWSDEPHPDKSPHPTLLHAVFAKGHFDLADILLNSELIADSLQSVKEFPRFCNLLHICVRNTNSPRASKITERHNLIVKLTHYNRALLNSMDSEGRTPLLAGNVCKSLLQALLELGANFNFVDETGRNVAELAEANFQHEEFKMFHKVLTATIREHNSQIETNFRTEPLLVMIIFSIIMLAIYDRRKYYYNNSEPPRVPKITT